MNTETSPGRQLSSREALTTIADRDGKKNFMKAVVHAVINTEEGRYPLKLAVIAAKPASLRLEAIPVIGLPDFFLSIHKGILKVHIPQEGEYYIGPATIKNLKSFFPIQLAVQDLVAFLMGCRPIIFSEQIRMNSFSEGKFHRVDILSNENHPLQSLWITPENLNLVRLDAFEKNEDGPLTVYFDEYYTENDVLMPSRIRFQSPGRDRRDISLKYESATFEPLTNETETLFDLPVPEGVKTIILE